MNRGHGGVCPAHANYSPPRPLVVTGLGSFEMNDPAHQDA